MYIVDHLQSTSVTIHQYRIDEHTCNAPFSMALMTVKISSRVLIRVLKSLHSLLGLFDNFLLGNVGGIYELSLLWYNASITTINILNNVRIHLLFR